MLPPTKTNILRLPPRAKFDVVPASQFTVQTLTDIYNDTRTDYIVPMPMNVAKMQAYIDHYDVDLSQSAVAVSEEGFLGLGMLGVREDRTWITRLGVTPNGRQKGVGRRLMDTLLQNSQHLKAQAIILEVIKDNTPAHTMFKSFGFQLTRELLVIRRPPKPIQAVVANIPNLQTLDHPQTVHLLATRTDVSSWVSATPSMQNAGNLSALLAPGQGWVSYQNTPFQLGRVVLQTEPGASLETATMLLQALHLQYPYQDTLIENLAADNKYWSVFEALEYLISFVRVEMVLDLAKSKAPYDNRAVPTVEAVASTMLEPC